jgi:hypothetical protein
MAMSRCWSGPVVALTLAVSGCGASVSEDPHPAPDPQRAAQAPGQRLDLGVARLDARIGGDRVSSAGIVLDAGRGLVLASAHPLWGATSLKVTTGLAVLHGRIVARDACDDLALVEVQPRLPGLVALRPSDDGGLRSGRAVRLVRRQSARPTGSSGGELETIAARPGAPAGAVAVLPGVPLRGALPLAGALSTESSGAPLLAPDGHLAGMAIVARSGGRTVAAGVPWSRISALMAQLRTGPRTVYVGWERHYRCAPAQHRGAAAQHPGFRSADARLNAPVPATRLPGTGGVDS